MSLGPDREPYPVSALPPFPNRTVLAPLVLVADDDPRVLELLEIALTQNHFRVITAADGEEAIRRALAERPDAAVLDVRMPRKSGIEVCEVLRHDPDDPHLPVVLVSASVDTESRLEGLAHGADEVLAKPFSPKELVARLQRLLLRNRDARSLRQRVMELERDVGRAQGDARRVLVELTRERRLREVCTGTGRELHRTLDLDELCDRVLIAAQRQLGSCAVALLAPEGDGTGTTDRFIVRAWRGDVPDRFASLALERGSGLAELLAGLGRPLARHELDRFAETHESLPAFVAAGLTLLVPCRGPHGLEAVLAAEEPAGHGALELDERGALALLCEQAALALRNAHRFRASQDRALEMLAERAGNGPLAAEARSLAAAAGEVLGLPSRETSLVLHAVALGAWGWSAGAAEQLASLEREDPTRRVRQLRQLVEAGQAPDASEDAPREDRLGALLTAVCVRHLVARRSGRSAVESWSTALQWVGGALDAEARFGLGQAWDRVFGREEAGLPAAGVGPPAHAGGPFAPTS